MSVRCNAWASSDVDEGRTKHEKQSFTGLTRCIAGTSTGLRNCGDDADGLRRWSRAAARSLPPPAFIAGQEGPGDEYVIGPLDELQAFSCGATPNLAARCRCGPDGRITTPLITDMPAVGKTPTMLRRISSCNCRSYINDPIVSVIVTEFPAPFQPAGPRRVGATEKPASIPFRANMTLLDAMISVGGLGEYAAGNRARLIRYNRANGSQQEYAIRINDLIRRGDTSANVRLQPGDVIIIPESAF